MNLETYEKQVYFEWGRLHKHIKKSLPYLSGSVTEDGLISAILNGSITLWPLEDAFILTTIEEYDEYKDAVVLLAGGDWGQVEGALEAIKRWAKEKGAKHLTAKFRLGFKRLYNPKRLGFVPKRVEYELEL